MIKNIVNPEGHQNLFSCLKVMAILLKGRTLPIFEVAVGRVCTWILRSRLVCICWTSDLSSKGFFFKIFKIFLNVKVFQNASSLVRYTVYTMMYFFCLTICLLKILKIKKKYFFFLYIYITKYIFLYIPSHGFVSWLSFLSLIFAVWFSVQSQRLLYKHSCHKFSPLISHSFTAPRNPSSLRWFFQL